MDKDGKATDIVEREFDGDTVTKETKKDGEGNVTESSEFTHNEKGQVIKETIKDKDGVKTGEKYNQYDEETGKLKGTREVKYENGEIKETVKTKYDEDGKVTEEVVLDKDGNVKENRKYEYNEEGEATTTITRPNGEKEVKKPGEVNNDEVVDNKDEVEAPDSKDNKDEVETDCDCDCKCKKVKDENPENIEDSETVETPETPTGDKKTIKVDIDGDGTIDLIIKSDKTVIVDIDDDVTITPTNPDDKIEVIDGTEDNNDAVETTQKGWLNLQPGTTTNFETKADEFLAKLRGVTLTEEQKAEIKKLSTFDEMIEYLKTQGIEIKKVY